MKRKLGLLLSVAAFALLLSGSIFAQETTGSIEVTARDAAGAVVPNVALTISSLGNSTGYKRTITTDDEGFARVIQVPPGTYSVTAAATSGFVEKIVSPVAVSLGKTTPIALTMATSVDVEVNVSSTDVQPIDTTSTKIQTTISAATAELLPKGQNFASLLKISPATRPEPRSGQFQIDGASGSENTFIIDGQEVTNVRTGVLDQNSNLPFSFIQEVQIKSSGFEAEYGGATGGVVNLTTKGGNNRWGGEIGSSFVPSTLQALPSPALRLNPNTAQPEYFPSQRDQYLDFDPTFALRGPILKDKAWFSVGFAPQIFTRTRTITYLNDATRLPTGRVETYRFKEQADRVFARVDAQPFSNVRITGTYHWDPIAQTGAIPSSVSSLSTPPVQAGNPTLNGGAYLNQTGGRQNAQNFTVDGAWSVTNNLIISARAGHYFLNEKLGTYGQGNPLIPRVLCSSSSPMQFPAGFGCVRGFNNGVSVIEGKLFDATKRNVYEVDATYIFNGIGRHQLKGGYQFNGIGNKVQIRDTDQIILRFGQTIASYSGTSIPSAPGALGAGQMVVFSTRGAVTSRNDAIYVQDKWQPVNWMTLNLGLRTEQEDVPSFTPGLPGIKFSWSSKFAPRLGAAFDLTGDGKTKLSAFYGWFYDRFKYELPRGSFGGDEYHALFFEIFAGDTLSSFTRAGILGSGGPIPGGSCPSTTTTVYGRVRCDIDFRISSNSGGPLTEVGGIDPNIKPFRQSEFTVTFERELTSNFLFTSRYTHKQVDRAVEDAGFPNAEGSEYYIIGNPGEGLYADQAAAFGLLAPKPERKYDALEFRLDRRFANNYYFSANYTYSRLFGNYSGLASSDEEGRLSPNVNRYFDQPLAGYTAAGGPDNGLLPTDRPHVLKFYGAYSFDWKKLGIKSKHTTEFQVFSTIQSGSLLTSFVSINNIDFIPLSKRGDLGRTEMFTQTDFAIRHRFKFGRDERFTLVAEGDALNVFNEHNVLNRVNDISLNSYSVTTTAYGLITPAQAAACNAAGNQQPCLIAGYQNFQLTGAPAIAAAASDPSARYQLYNLPSSYQGGRSIRLGLRLIF